MTYAVFTYPPPKMIRGEPVRWTQTLPPEQPHPFRYVYDELTGDFKAVAKDG